MADSTSGPNRSAPLSPDEAFALLGNETRVTILEALWDAFRSGTGGRAVPFSELFDRVGISDSGNFSYHLEKLAGHFVRRTDEGYELTQSGINVVRAVVAGTVVGDSVLGPTPVDVVCPRCEAPVEFTYADELMIISCTSCPGRSPWNGEPGHLFGAFVPPLGVDQHGPGEAFHAAVAYSLYETSIFHAGVCPHCLDPVDTTVDVCADHEPGDALCPACDRFNLADAWMVCATCKRSIPPPVSLLALDHPTVTAFYHDHGVEHRFASWETVVRSFRVGEEVVSDYPLRMQFTIPGGGEELQLTLDHELAVLEATR